MSCENDTIINGNEWLPNKMVFKEYYVLVFIHYQLKKNGIQMESNCG